jgi:hypothetical protein
MMSPENTAYIIGNGASRQPFDLMILRGKGTVFGCNALYRDFSSTSPKYVLPDFLVAIDEAITTEIESSDFPSKRVIIPPENEKWEPVELHWGRSATEDWNPARPRSNAGMNAILEAIKKGYSDIYIFGFDSLVVDNKVALSNLYDGTDCYGYDTRANLQDTRNRMTFLGWVIEKNPDTHFTFCYPKDMIDSGVYLPQAPNVSISNFDEMMSKL